mmetsp:Transcript_32146/g.68012  ORF Transcript_32146/g.68012 Transcript_32146/m.68012 type:complete len:265 (+) Transcript_32146:2283-3077(+)
MLRTVPAIQTRRQPPPPPMIRAIVVVLLLVRIRETLRQTVRRARRRLGAEIGRRPGLAERAPRAAEAPSILRLGFGFGLGRGRRHRGDGTAHPTVAQIGQEGRVVVERRRRPRLHRGLRLRRGRQHGGLRRGVKALDGSGRLALGGGSGVVRGRVPPRRGRGLQRRFSSQRVRHGVDAEFVRDQRIVGGGEAFVAGGGGRTMGRIVRRSFFFAGRAKSPSAGGIVLLGQREFQLNGKLLRHDSLGDGRLRHGVRPHEQGRGHGR